MDPVALVLTALGTGAALGVKDTASVAVKDAYNGLKSLVKRRLSGHEDGQVVLGQYEKSPTKWEPMLASELADAGAAQDEDLIAAAQLLLSLTDPAGAQTGKYIVQVSGGEGVQVGDYNTQTNTFGNSPGQ